MLKEMIVKKSREYGMVLRPVLVFVCSLIMVLASDGRVMLPLVCAVAGALSPLSSAAVAAGGMLGFVFMGTAFKNAFVVCSLILIVAGKWITREDKVDKTSMFVTFISMSFSGLVFGLVAAGDFRQTAVNILYAVICMAVVYFIMQAKEILSCINSISADRKTIGSLAVVYIFISAVLCGAEVFFINIGIVLSVLVLLCACRFFGMAGGLVCGALTTVSALAGDVSLADETIFFGIAGLVAGAASHMSRITIATAFSGTVLLGQLVLGMNDRSFFVQSAIILASVLFMLIPEKVVTKGGRICSGAVKESSDYLSKEMEFAAKSLCDVRENVNEIMKHFSQSYNSCDSVKKVSDKVCSKCRKKLECWESNFEATNEAFCGYDSKKSFPVNFECLNKIRVMEEFEKCGRERAASKMLSARLCENQSFLFAQMQASEDIVTSLSEKLSVDISKSMTAVLCRTLEKYDINYNSAVVFNTHGNRLVAEIYIPEPAVIEYDELCVVLSRELSVPLEYSQPFVSCGEIRLRFNQKTKYTVETAEFCLSARENEPSGDTCGYFTDGLGFGYAFLSDGMGSGKGAAVSSKLTAKLFKRLIRLGLSCECAVKTVNCIMLAKTGEESFATLDIARINLETGGVTLFKSGASATLVRYDKGVMMYSFPSNPVGIIPDIEISERNCDFSDNDVLVLMSDGVPESCYLYVKEQLILDKPLEELSENICRYSRKISSGKRPDDVTAISIKLEKNAV